MTKGILGSSTPKCKAKREISPQLRRTRLVRETFKALKPFINVRKCGQWLPSWDGKPDGPKFMISTDQWDMLRRRQRGERPTYWDGRPFTAWHVLTNILAPKHVRAMLDGRDKHYYTGGDEGLTAFKADVDAHEPWQDDADETRDDVEGVFGAENVFSVGSTRGYNLHVKIDYKGVASAAEVNATLTRLEKALKTHTAARKCTVEIKGKIAHPACVLEIGEEVKTLEQSSGTLAKLPCFGAWDEQRLAEWVALPIKPYSWLLATVERLEKANADRPSGAKKTARQRPKSGSCVGVSIATGVVEALPDAVRYYKQLSYYLYAQHVAPRRKDVRLTAVDFAIAMAVISAFATSPKADASLPQLACKRLWMEAYSAGLVSRAWNDSRWAAIWRTLADCQMIDVVDERYWWSDGTHKGQ
jgi:hypothetical protein